MFKLPPVELLKESFEYKDGLLIWKVRPLSHFKSDHSMKVINNRQAGKIAQSNCNGGYYGVSVLNQRCRVHRIIFAIHYGRDPYPFEIDHKDGNPKNNFIDNLRLATSSNNKMNVGIKSNNSSGAKGVSWCELNKAWRGRVQKDKKCQTRYFKSKEKCNEWVTNTRNIIHGEFINHG